MKAFVFWVKIFIVFSLSISNLVNADTINTQNGHAAYPVQAESIEEHDPQVPAPARYNAADNFSRIPAQEKAKALLNQDLYKINSHHMGLNAVNCCAAGTCGCR